MRKMNKKISVWMMAGVLAFGGISAAGGAVPVLAAEEKKEEKDSEPDPSVGSGSDGAG